jgi:hypothetical protein
MGVLLAALVNGGYYLNYSRDLSRQMAKEA